MSVMKQCFNTNACLGSVPSVKKFRKVSTIDKAIESDITQTTGDHIWTNSPISKQHSQILTIHEAVTVEVS